MDNRTCTNTQVLVYLMKCKYIKFGALFCVVVLTWPTVSLASQSTGGDVNNFDIQPRMVTAGQQVRVTLQVTIYGGSPSAFMEYCGISSNPSREVIWLIRDDNNNTIYNNKLIYNPFTYQNESYDLSFNGTAPDSPGNTTYYAQLRCVTNSSPISGSLMSESAGIFVTQPGGPVDCDNNICTNGAGPCTTVDDCTGGGGPNSGANLDFPPPYQTQTITDLLDGILTFALQIGIPIAVIVIVYAGIMFLFARGDSGKVTKARAILLYAVIGLAVIFIGKGFLTLIENILDLAS